MRGEISAIFSGKKVESTEAAAAMTLIEVLSVYVEFLRGMGFDEQVRAAIPFELK